MPIPVITEVPLVIERPSRICMEKGMRFFSSLLLPCCIAGLVEYFALTDEYARANMCQLNQVTTCSYTTMFGYKGIYFAVDKFCQQFYKVGIVHPIWPGEKCIYGPSWKHGHIFHPVLAGTRGMATDNIILKFGQRFVHRYGIEP